MGLPKLLWSLRLKPSAAENESVEVDTCSPKTQPGESGSLSFTTAEHEVTCPTAGEARQRGTAGQHWPGHSSAITENGEEP